MARITDIDEYLGVFTNFQSESKRSGDAFEDMVLNDIKRMTTSEITKNYFVPLTGCQVDFAFNHNGQDVYVEAKGGFQGEGKRPGARRTDSVKKAIANAALIKYFEPDSRYIVYFSDTPMHGSSSYQMIQTAIMAGFLDQVIYLANIE